MKETSSTELPVVEVGVEAGLPQDPIEFKALTEIAIIAHLSDTMFAKYLPDGLTTAQFGVLNHLLRLNRQETISELASAMQVSQPTMSSTVRKLEDKGFIELVANNQDRRIRRVRVTKEGADIRGQSVAAIQILKANLLQNEALIEWETLLPLLTKLRVLLDKAR